jgi:hypothetical protein
MERGPRLFIPETLSGACALYPRGTSTAGGTVCRGVGQGRWMRDGTSKATGLIALEGYAVL